MTFWWTAMTRRDIIEKSAAYSRAVTRIGWPCAILSLLAAVAWRLVHSPRDDVNFLFLGAVAAPVATCLIALERLHKRLKVECPHCHNLLSKRRVQQHVFGTGRCPFCRERILDDQA